MKKLVSILLAFCIFVMQFGCAPAKRLSMDKASRMNRGKYSMVIHTPTNKYNLFGYKFTADVLFGELEMYSRPKGKSFHVYTNQNFDLYSTNESSQSITLERSNIKKITTINHLQRNPLVIVGVITLVIILMATSEGTGFFDKQ